VPEQQEQPEESPDSPQAIMSCLEMPSLCQGYMQPAVQDFSNENTKAAMGCIESEGSNFTKSAECLEPAVRAEMKALKKDPSATHNIFDLMQCAVCMKCIVPDTVSEDVGAAFNCSNVHPSGNWDGDWQKFLGGGGDAGGSAGGFDYSQYMSDGGAAGGAGGGAGGFDYSKYMTGGGASGGGGAGGFDWQQYVNGGSGGGAAGGDDAPAPAPAAGYDWQQWMPGGAKDPSTSESPKAAAADEAAGAFDWEQYLPGGSADPSASKASP
jgi:hypothetical protein